MSNTNHIIILVLIGTSIAFQFTGFIGVFAQTASEIDIAFGAGSSANAACVVKNNCFYPNPLTVAPGTTVTWKNTDGMMHAICSGYGNDPQCGKVFEDDSLKPGTTFQFTFQNAGTYRYYCSVHPWMTGQVIVGSAEASSTQSDGSMQVGSMNTTTSPVVTASVDKLLYTYGDTMTISGTVQPVTPGTPGTIQILDPSNDLVLSTMIIVSQDGRYSSSVSVTGPYWKSDGVYTIKVQYGPPNVTAQTTFTYESKNPYLKCTDCNGTGNISQTQPVPTPVPVPTPEPAQPTVSKIPHWVKAVFNLYGQGQISDDDLISALSFLIQTGVIKVS